MKKALISIIGVIFVGYISLSTYAITTLNIEELLVCTDSDRIYKIPFAKSICRGYLFTFRGSQQDIADLHQGVGASFVLNGYSTAPEREQVLKYLISKGLDVNHLDRHMFLPLHGAVLSNSADEVGILLRNGANPNLKDKKYELTPLELALKFQAEDKFPEDREERQTVISLLKNAK